MGNDYRICCCCCCFLYRLPNISPNRTTPVPMPWMLSWHWQWLWMKRWTIPLLTSASRLLLRTLSSVELLWAINSLHEHYNVTQCTCTLRIYNLDDHTHSNCLKRRQAMAKFSVGAGYTRTLSPLFQTGKSAGITLSNFLPIKMCMIF